MKNRYLITFLLAVMFAGQVWAGQINYTYDISAKSSSGQTLYYKITSSTEPYTVEVAYYPDGTKPSGNLTIPETIISNGKSYSVTSIGDYAFSGLSGLTAVTIPESVTNIGERVFYNCSNLKSIFIPNSIISIGELSFWGCNSLQYNEYDNAFYLGNVENQYVCLVEVKSKDIASCEINNKIIYIRAFESCKELATIRIPNSVISIGENAFRYGVKNVIYDGCASGSPWGARIANGTPDENGFIYADNQKKQLVAYVGNDSVITIPNTVTSIGWGTFYGCSGLSSIIIPNTISKIDAGAIYECFGIKSVTIPNSVENIEMYAFYGCKNLRSVVIPNSVKKIGTEAFEYCSNLEFVSLPDSIIEIEGSIFKDCSNLVSITISNSVKIIRSQAFENCSSLLSIIIPDSVTSIGSSAFNGCISLSYMTIPNLVSEIGDKAFYDCNSLTSIRIPNSVKTIKEYAFKDCDSLKYVTIPNSVKYINRGVFSDCKNLTIYCESDSKPKDWNSTWVDSSVKEIVWNSQVTMAKITASVNNNAYGCVVGSGIYPLDSIAVTAILTAKATEGYHFVCWSDGETINPRTINVTGDYEITAIFESENQDENNQSGGNENQGGNEQGEENQSGNNENQGGNEQGKENQGGENTNPTTAVPESAALVNIYAAGKTIVVENATEEIRVYDAMGKLVCRNANTRVRSTINVKTTGVYIVKIGGTVKRVVVN